jgi:diguanylate cyclase (GGDEF)-like protein
MPADERPSPLRVVLISPDAALTERIGGALAALGHDVQRAATVAGGVELCRAAGADVAVLDDAIAPEERSVLRRDPDLYATTMLLAGEGVLSDADLSGGVQDHLGLGHDPAALRARVAAAGLTAQLRRELDVQAARLEALAYTDELTKVHNRRFVGGQLNAQVASATRHGRTLAVALVDLDRFKPINDEHGHDAGDRVLATVAKRMAARLRKEDVLGRWGGEEFLVLLPDTGAAGALHAAEDLRSAVGGTPIRWHASPLRVTVSAGVAVRRAGETPEQLLRRADEALYAAKDAGRDRVVLAPDPLGTAFGMRRQGEGAGSWMTGADR